MCRWRCARFFFFKLLNIVIYFFLFALIWIGCVRLHRIESWANTLTARSAVLRRFMVDSCEFTATGITFYGRVRITVSSKQRHLLRQFCARLLFSFILFVFCLSASSRWHFHLKLRLIIFYGKISSFSLFLLFHAFHSAHSIRRRERFRHFFDGKNVKRSKTKKVNNKRRKTGK